MENYIWYKLRPRLGYIIIYTGNVHYVIRRQQTVADAGISRVHCVFSFRIYGD